MILYSPWVSQPLMIKLNILIRSDIKSKENHLSRLAFDQIRALHTIEIQRAGAATSLQLDVHNEAIYQYTIGR